ncbi:LysR family transcriptional regulator [Marinobacterium nitratireducens]|uniref:LysR family transcriptional regulator n=1 Tax=Marinobacterium nitratireducens TaxID=518897 RepID=A0A917ZAT5_9GAMM|nr:LysR family transcriptional regulator [Marinobacterium nitratireducens]GGO79138.1 LysR family transcriptional regulator [Marinobacterium nitratireducens]
MDRLEAMSMLVKISEMGSFSAASRALKVPLATLSRRISDLEALLGARLLIRTTRKLTLTDAGTAYVAAARRILEQVEDAEREASGEFSVPKGELVITAPLMFGRLYLLPVVAEFLAQYSQIKIRLQLSDRNTDLIDEQVDMALRIGTLADSSMVATPVGGMRTVCCASPAFLAAHGIPRSANDLLRFPCITVDTPMPSPAWRFGAAGTRRDIPVEPRLSVTTPEAVAQAAILGVGIARLLHYQVAAAVARQELQIVLEDCEPLPSPVNLVHPSRGRMPLKMRCFLDFAVPRLREALSRLS